MATPALQLLVVNGPRCGETLECSPAAAPIRIGRVARGNTFAFKDPGISQKHLTLDLLPSSASGWALTDLGSSNGTFLNGTPLEPSHPVPISAGDSIKVGEITTITVNVVAGCADPEAPAGPRRTRASSTRGANKDVALEPAAELKRGRGRRGKALVKDEVLEVIEEDSVGISAEEEVLVENSKKYGTLELVEEVRDEILQLSVEKKAEEKRNLGRRGRGRGRGGGRGRTRASSASVSIDAVVAEAPETTPTEDLGKNNGEKEDDLVGSGEGEKRVDENGAGENDDLDRMTLGEWFDRMEKYLPQMINDASEELIASLREKGRRLNEFVDNMSNAA